MMKLVYVHAENDQEVLGEVMTSHSISVEDALELLNIDMEDYSQQQGWEDYDYNALRVESV